MADDLETSLLEAIRKQEKANPKYNNPGNLKPAGSFTYEGQTDTSPEGFAIFDSMASGEQALRGQIKRNIGRGLTLKEFFGGGKGYPGYAPKTDRNDPETYAANVASWTGIDPNTPLNKISGGPVADQQNYDDMSLQDLQKLSQQLHQQINDLSKSTAKTNGTGGTKVEPPSRFARWAGGGFGIKPAAQDIVKAFQDPDWRDKASDVIEAGGELAPLTMAGTLAAAPFTGGISTLLPIAYKMALGGLGSYAASWLADQLGGMANLDPKTRRLVDDIAGLGGGIAGYKGGPGAVRGTARLGYKGATSPVGGAVIGGALAHQVGLPEWAGIFARKSIPAAIERATPDFFKRWIGETGTSKGTNLGTVAAPGKPLPRTTVEDDMVRTGSLTPDQYMQRMRDMGMADDAAAAKLAHAQRTGAETNARSAGNRGRTAQGPVTITPTEEQLRSSTNPQGPVTVNIPPGLKVQTTALPTGPVSPPPGGTAAMAPQNFPPQAPIPPPAPGSLGTVGPLGPTPQGPPLQGPAARMTPISPELGQPPVQSPVAPTRPNVPTSTLDLPVRPPGEIPRPITPPSGPVPTRTPSGTMPPTDFERSSQEVYRIARKLGQAPPITSNKLTLTRWQKLLGFLPTRDQMIEGRRLYHEWVKSGRPTATNPTDADLK